MIKEIPAILTLKDLQELLHIGKNKALELVQSNIIEGHKVGNQWRDLHPGCHRISGACVKAEALIR